MSSAYTDNFTSSLPIWICFISLSCLIPVAGPSNAMLIRSGESGHPCLIPDFSGKAFSFSPLSIMLAVVKNFYMVKRPNFFRIWLQRAKVLEGSY